MSRFRHAVRVVRFACLEVVSLGLGLPSLGQQAAHPLPQAIPGTSYAAQLAIPPGLGYPFAKCELLGSPPRWLMLDCSRLQLKGKVPVGMTGETNYQTTLHVEDAAGHQLSFPLSLLVSASPQLVSLTTTDVHAMTDQSEPTQARLAADSQPTLEKPVNTTRLRPSSVRPSAARIALVDADLSMTTDISPSKAVADGTSANAIREAAKALKMQHDHAAVKPAAADRGTVRGSDSKAPMATDTKAVALPDATKGLLYSVPLQIKASDGTALPSDAVYTLKEGPEWPAGLTLTEDKGVYTLSGTPDYTLDSGLPFTVVVSEDGVAHFTASYMLKVDNPPTVTTKLSDTTELKPLGVKNPIVVGQGFSEGLGIDGANACKAYTLAIMEPSNFVLADWKLRFDSTTATLSSDAVDNIKKVPVPSNLVVSLTCTTAAGTAYFSIPIEGNREAAVAIGQPVHPPACSADTPEACDALEALRNLPASKVCEANPKGDECKEAKDKSYQNLIDAVHFDSSELIKKAANDPSSTTVAQKTAWETEAQSWSDFACDLVANQFAFKHAAYTVPSVGYPPASASGCYQSSPYFRTVLGGLYSAASSTDPQFKLVADLSVDLPIGSDKHTNDVPDSQRNWLWVTLASAAFRNKLQ